MATLEKLSRALKPLDMNEIPTYQDLVDLVCTLVEVNVSNLDVPDSRFVGVTYSAGNIPEHWLQAIQAREAFIKHKMMNPHRYMPQRMRDRQGNVP